MLKALAISIGVVCCLVFSVSSARGQGRKPTRVKPPEFDSEDRSVFFDNPASLLKGQLPSKQAAPTQPKTLPGKPSAGEPDAADDPQAWHKLISPTALEDLIKGSKLRLEKIVTTPSQYASGGAEFARREFSMQALLFAIVDNYPGEVRWKKSAGVAREALARAAANSKVGSIQSFNEAKQRMLDLDDLMNGSQLAGKANSEIEWSNLIDRAPLMQLLKWAQRDYVEKHAASEKAFKANLDELKRYSELIAVLGKASLQEEMPDAADDDYMAYANEMILQAQQVVLAVDTNSSELARSAASKLGQSCANCHDDFR